MGQLRPGDVLENRYRIDKMLGEGGMSWVYRGHHLLLEQPVAIKVVKPLYAHPKEAREHAEQLRVEASIMARLDHPNLVRAFDMFMHGQESVLVLEMIEGRNLEEVVELAPKPLAERRVLAWTSQILDALEYLHSQKPPVIVRDLKPGNIMLGQDGRIRLIDFGLAKRMDAQGSGTRAIVRGMGSEGYAPLEQYASASTDGRSDLYALGASMYFLLTKLTPPAATLRVADDSALADARELNPSLREETWHAILNLMALRPDGRPANAAEAREALGLVPARTTLAPPPTVVTPRAPGKRCVVCDVLLRPVMTQGVEIDCCNDCGGVWLDRGELGRLVEIGRQDGEGEGPTLPAKSPGFQGGTPREQGRGGETRPEGSMRHVGRRASAFDRSRERREPQPIRTGLLKVWRLLEELFD
jgi:serine/threonine-protein kinase